MIDLTKQYEEKYTLRPETYANAAIAFLDWFELYGNEDYFNSAIENCNKSIKALPDYGLAFALKIELYIMAISKSFNDAAKHHFENELLRVFKDIENNNSPLLCGELISRFEIDKQGAVKPYIELLYKEYPDNMSIIESRSVSVVQENTSPANPVASESVADINFRE